VTILTSNSEGQQQLGSTLYRENRMARKEQKSLAQTVVALAATALVEKAVQTAAEDPRVRRKAKAAGKTIKKNAKAAVRKITR
jgi:hypothetical protein